MASLGLNISSGNGCVLHEPNCVRSAGYPQSNYPDDSHCTVVNVPALPIVVNAFDVEPSYSSTEACDYDYLFVAGATYCGTSGPAGVVTTEHFLHWQTDAAGVMPQGLKPRFAAEPVPLCQAAAATN